MNTPVDAVRVQVTREANVPDPLKLERYRLTPSLGPRVLFFSGGTALRDTARELVQYTHNSIHVVTPFDSGGSSAEIRRRFNMLAVGDVRNRLMALADQSIQGNPEVFELFAHRLPEDQTQEELVAELERMSHGEHALLQSIHDPMHKIICNHFSQFLNLMPANFDLRGASIGNLVLAAGYLSNRRHFDPVIYIFSQLVSVRGIVRPVVNDDLHLAVRLEDGEVLVGQHRITGKGAKPLDKRIVDIWLARDWEDPTPVETSIREKMQAVIGSAELICFPIGSFFSSVVANLLAKGTGKAIASNGCPKIYVPNSVADPECKGMDLVDQVQRLVHTLRQDAGEDVPVRALLNYVLVDTEGGDYPAPVDIEALSELGVQVIDCPLARGENAPLVNPELLVPVLLSLT